MRRTNKSQIFVIGLTGSIGMGKSTTARMFREEGIPVFDADACVHNLYMPGSAAIKIFSAHPALKKSVIRNKADKLYIDREILSKMIEREPAIKGEIEKIIHPIVSQAREQFIQQMQRAGHRAVVCDIPLLFETGGHLNMDALIVCTAPKSVQKKRVLIRPNMTEEKFNYILSQQMPDQEKRIHADFIVQTGLGLWRARQDVKRILKTLGFANTKLPNNCYEH